MIGSNPISPTKIGQNCTEGRESACFVWEISPDLVDFYNQVRTDLGIERTSALFSCVLRSKTQTFSEGGEISGAAVGCACLFLAF